MDIKSGAGLHACADSFDATHMAFAEARIANFLLQETYLLCHHGMIDSGQKCIRFNIDGFRVLGQYRADNQRPCAAQTGNTGQFFEFLLTQHIGQTGLKGCKPGTRSFLSQRVFFF